MGFPVSDSLRDWLLEGVGGGQYSFIKRDDKTVVRTIVAKSDIDAENQCQSIIKATKNIKNIEFIGER